MFWYLSGVHPQKVHSGSLCGTFQGIELTKYAKYVLELVPLRGKNISSHAHKVGTCYLLEVCFKIFNKHPHPLLYRTPKGLGGGGGLFQIGRYP